MLQHPDFHLFSCLDQPTTPNTYVIDPFVPSALKHLTATNPCSIHIMDMNQKTSASGKGLFLENLSTLTSEVR